MENTILTRKKLKKGTQAKIEDEAMKRSFVRQKIRHPRLWMSALTLLADLLAWLIVAVMLWAVGSLSGWFTFIFSSTCLLLPIFYVAFAASTGLYALVGLNPVDEIRKVFLAVSGGIVLTVLLLFFLLPYPAPNPPLLFLALWFSLLCAILFLRWSVRILLVRLGLWGEAAAIVVSDMERASDLIRYFGQRQRLGIRPALIVMNHLDNDQRLIDGVPTIHFETLLEDASERGPFDTLLIDIGSISEYGEFFHQPKFYAFFRQALFISAQGWFDGASLVVRDFEGIVGFEAKTRQLSPAKSVIKRLIDILGSLILLLISAPLWLWAMLAVKRDSSGPVFYTQTRIGKGGKPFDVLKFRTMMVNAERHLKAYLAQDRAAKDEWDTTQKLKNDPRITKPGKWIRKFSIDELPQVLNILKGEMSLVGPRPIVADEKVRYQDALDVYQSVRPGLTGMWQVSGRNDTTYAERVAFDVYYVRNWSLWLDLYILLRTVWVVVVTQDGAN